ncbi:MAG: hypothetical protein EXR21_09100 [Flavobacteriaceae bacterium]|nr:hypothetical protein [Flavobacteriaceae bacterium]
MTTDLTTFIAKQRQQLKDSCDETEHKLAYYKELIETYDELVEVLIAKERKLKNSEPDRESRVDSFVLEEYSRTKLERIEAAHKLFYNRIMLGKYATLCETSEAQALLRDREVAANFDKKFYEVKTALQAAKLKGDLPKPMADLYDLLSDKTPASMNKVDKGIIYGVLMTT